jgi:glycosyltransferase involved in cell wall biosynthesis
MPSDIPLTASLRATVGAHVLGSTHMPPADARPGVRHGADVSLHIGFAAPIATQDIRHLLHDPAQHLPVGSGGAPLSAALIEGLLALGHKVTAFTLSGGMPTDPRHSVVARGPNFSIEYCPMRLRAWQPNGWRLGRIVDLYAFERRALQAAMARARPDIVHAHWAYEYAWAGQRSGLPTLVTSHDSPFTIARFYKGFTHGGYRWLRAFMAWQVLRQARLVSTVSPYMVNQIQPLCRVPVEVVPNPVSDKVFAMQRSTEPGRQRVLMVCNGWSARKNPEPALRAFAEVAQRLPAAELVLLGHELGPGEDGERWWREQGLQGRVSFVGAVPHPQVLQWMTQSDLLLHPSLEESFGAVLAEAMAIGLPVVAGRDSGAVPWVVGEHGRLVDVQSPSAIAAALIELLGNAELAASLGRTGRESVLQRFSAQSVLERYLGLYRRLVTAPAAA